MDHDEDRDAPEEEDHRGDDGEEENQEDEDGDEESEDKQEEDDDDGEEDEEEEEESLFPEDDEEEDEHLSKDRKLDDNHGVINIVGKPFAADAELTHKSHECNACSAVSVQAVLFSHPAQMQLASLLDILGAFDANMMRNLERSGRAILRIRGANAAEVERVETLLKRFREKCPGGLLPATARALRQCLRAAKYPEKGAIMHRIKLRAQRIGKLKRQPYRGVLPNTPHKWHFDEYYHGLNRRLIEKSGGRIDAKQLRALGLEAYNEANGAFQEHRRSQDEKRKEEKKQAAHGGGATKPQNKKKRKTTSARTPAGSSVPDPKTRQTPATSAAAASAAAAMPSPSDVAGTDSDTSDVEDVTAQQVRNKKAPRKQPAMSPDEVFARELDKELNGDLAATPPVTGDRPAAADGGISPRAMMEAVGHGYSSADARRLFRAFGDMGRDEAFVLNLFREGYSVEQIQDTFGLNKKPSASSKKKRGGKNGGNDGSSGGGSGGGGRGRGRDGDGGSDSNTARNIQFGSQGTHVKVTSHRDRSICLMPK